jgi:hypothetical protein
MSEPQKFRKKPVAIEAMQFAGTPAELCDAYLWVESHVGSFCALDPIPDAGISIDPEDGSLLISTLEGLMRVSLGDWIIRGVKGEFYPCKPDIFAATYERLEADR